MGIYENISKKANKRAAGINAGSSDFVNPMYSNIVKKINERQYSSNLTDITLPKPTAPLASTSPVISAPKPDKSAIQAQNYNRLMNLAAESGFAAKAAQRARAGELASGRDFVMGSAPSSFGTERVDYGVKSIGQTGIGAVPQIAATAKQTAENAAAAANSKEYAANRARLFMLQNGLSDIPEYDKRKEQEAAIKEQLNTVIQNEELNKAVDKNTFGMKMLRGAKESQERALAGLNPTERLIGSSLISVGQNAAMLPTALINPAAPLVGMGAIASADKMYELSERGIGAGEAFTRGVVSGAIEAATEKIPLDNMLTMLKSASGREVIKNILRQMGTEAGEEAVSYIANYVADKAANDPQASFSPSELAQAAAAGAISGGIMGGAGTAIGTLRSGGAEKIYALTEQKLQENAPQAENTANSQTIGNMENVSEQQEQPLTQEERFAKGMRSGLVPSKSAYKVNVRTRRALSNAANRLGVKITFDDTLNGENGRYDPRTGVIHIALDSADPIGVIATHEMTHRMKETSPELYENFKNIAFGIMQENGSFENVRNAVIESYGENAAIDDEILAHYTRNIVEDIEEFEKLVGVNRNLAQRIFDFFDQLIRKAGWDNNAQVALDNLFGDIGIGKLQRSREAWRVMLDKADAAAQGSGVEQRMVNPNFAAEYDAWDKKTGNGYFNIGSTSAALQSIGINPSNIYWDKSKIKKIKLEHPEMTDSIIKQVPQMLENPVIVMQSQTVKNRVVALGEVYADGKPVLCALELKPDGRIDNFIKVASAYGKNGVQTLLNNSDILYLEPNKNRTDNWLKALGLQLPSAQTNYGSIGRVTYYDDVVNSQPQPTKTAMQAAFEKASTNTQHTQNSAEDAQVMQSKPLASLKRQFEPHEQPINTRRELGGSAINRIGEAGAFDNVKTLLLTAENERENREKQKEKTATIATPADMKRGRKNIEDAISGFTRKIVDSGERVDKIAKAVGDDVLYPLYNNARQARSAAMNNIGVAQTDLQGRKVGKSVADIVTPIKAKGERYWEAFQQYVYHLHNIDSMTLETRGANILYNELQKLVEQNPILANIETADEKTLKEIKNSPQYKAVFNEWQKIYARMKGIKNKPVFGRKITAEDSQSIVSTLEMAYPEIAKEAQQIFDYYKNMMRDNVSAGLISEKERQTLEMLYPHYVPVMTNSPRVSISSKDNVARVEDVHKARTANERMLLPIDEAMARKTLSSIAAQKRNLFGIRLLEHALTDLDKTGRDVVSISDSDLPYDIDAEEAPDLSNKFTVWVDGETVDMAVSPELMEGVRAIMPKPSDKNYAAELVAGTMNLFKKSVTSHNLFFVATNALKDFQDAMFYTKQNPVKFAANYKKAYEEIATGGELWELYRAMGGVGNSYFNYGEGVELPNYRGIKKLGAKIEGINLMVEQAPRLAEFIDIVEKGGRGYENLQKALLAAADITVNFGRSGEWGKNLNKYAVAFFNPAVQGTSKWKRALLSKNGKRAAALMITKAALLSMLPTLFNEWWWYDDEEYQMLTDSVKDNYYLFKMSNGIWLRIPKGRALMPLANLASRTYRMARGDEKAWEGYLQSTLGAIAPNNPFTDNIIMPLYEAQLFNPKSAGKTWYGGDIESMAMQNLEPRDRTDEYTSDIANIVGKTLNVSPKKIHHVLDSYTGVWGDMLLPTTAPGVTGAWPLIDRFYTDVNFKNRLASDYYSALDEVTQQKNSKPTPAAYAQYDALNDFEKDISDANKRIKNLQNSDMSRFEKADAVKEARKELNEIYREALEEAQAAKEKAEEEFKAIPPEAFERAVRAADSATGTKEIKNGKERTVPLSLARNQKAAIDKATPELNRRQREAIYMMLGINEKVW